MLNTELRGTEEVDQIDAFRDVQKALVGGQVPDILPLGMYREDGELGLNQVLANLVHWLVRLVLGPNYGDVLHIGKQLLIVDHIVITLFLLELENTGSPTKE